jgi:hypothetical protein
VARDSRARSAALKSSWPTGPRRGGNNEAFAVHHGRQGPGLSLHAWSHPLMLEVMQGSYRQEARGFTRADTARRGGAEEDRCLGVGGLSTSCGDCQPCTACPSASHGLECRKSSRFEARPTAGTAQPCINIGGWPGGPQARRWQTRPLMASSPSSRESSLDEQRRVRV